MNCCQEGCTRNVPCDFKIRAGREVLLRIPLFCLVEKLQALMDDEVDMETYFPGLDWCGTGAWDLERFKEEASEILSIRVSAIFGGKVREYFFPGRMGDNKVVWIKDYREAFEAPIAKEGG